MFDASITKINQFLAPVEHWISLHRRLIQIALLVLAYGSLLGLFFPSFQKESGEHAFLLLLILLILSPLAQVTGITLLKKLLPFRKELGICMGMLVIVHYGLFLIMNWSFLEEMSKEPQLWAVAGFWATVLTLILTITSNTWSVRFLGKWWKRLHRLAYGILVLTVVHVIAIKYSTGRLDLDALVPSIFWLVLKIADMCGVRLSSSSHARNS
jgi:DMSO/TMAO reductase YedYZ heme-binding membrane subunit